MDNMYKSYNEKLVIHPNHYNKKDRKECWDEMILISPVGTAFFDLWSAYKYLYRAGEKVGNPEEQDLAKINNYIEHAEMLINKNNFQENVLLDMLTMINILKAELITKEMKREQE